MKKKTNEIELNVNTYSSPSELRITDMKFTDIAIGPMHSIMMKLETNQGLVGYGEVRDSSEKAYALMLKSRILGENPCDINRIFNKIKHFGTHSRGGGGVSAVEIALWDLAGKAYNVPIYQMLGGKVRDKVRVYCDTDIDGKPDGKRMGKALKERLDQGFTLLKMDLGIDLLYHVKGALSGPVGMLDALKAGVPYGGENGGMNYKTGSIEQRYERNRAIDNFYIQHQNTGIQITPKGFEWLDKYMKDVRSVIGYEVPIAIDHLGHISITEAIKLGKLCEKYNIAWMEDAVPWMFTEQYKLLQSNVAVPVCTGEDIFGHENFEPLILSGGVSVVHPDILTCGGISECKRISEFAAEHGVSMCIHEAESPIAALAAAHVATACENFYALEFHAFDHPWWDKLVEGPNKPLVNKGFITLDPNAPGLGITGLNEELIAKHIFPGIEGQWEDTSEWNDRICNDRIWS